MSKILVYAVHGFLGQASDWNAVKSKLSKSDFDFKAIDLFKKDSLEVEELEEYTARLAEHIEDECDEDYEKRIFIGYSLGGRLGLHLMQEQPDLFDHYIFLSTNPGFDETAGKEKNERLFSDMKWAQQISDTNWDKFITDWNSQKVFEGSKNEPIRNLKDYDLIKLKKALVIWSLAQQQEFSEEIYDNQELITWVVGSEDSKYLKIAENFKEKKILLDFKRISAGHRILFDNPSSITELIQQLCFS